MGWHKNELSRLFLLRLCCKSFDYFINSIKSANFIICRLNIYNPFFVPIISPTPPVHSISIAYYDLAISLPCTNRNIMQIANSKFQIPPDGTLSNNTNNES